MLVGLPCGGGIFRSIFTKAHRNHIETMQAYIYIQMPINAFARIRMKLYNNTAR